MSAFPLARMEMPSSFIFFLDIPVPLLRLEGGRRGRGWDENAVRPATKLLETLVGLEQSPGSRLKGWGRVGRGILGNLLGKQRLALEVSAIV